jgi:hypothetical protein
MNLGLRGEGTRGGEDGSLRVQVFCKEDVLIGKYNLAQDFDVFLLCLYPGEPWYCKGQ